MKKFSLLCLLIVGLYPNITQARVCFLADQNCNASTLDTEPVSTLSCPAEYSVSPDQVCEGKIYKECRIEDLNQSLYKDLGCDKDNGYYDINDPNISFYPYVCAETACENCCNKFKCDTEVFKNCSSPKIGGGDTCEEKDEQYYVNGNSIKFSECNCNTAIYPYNAKNCSGDDYILKGDKCVGDSGTYWTECYNNSCQYTSEYDCESQLENSDCVKDSEGCWNFAGCKQNYAYGKEVNERYSAYRPAKCISCNIYSYDDLTDNFITYTGVCPTVWFKADITTPKSQDSYTTELKTGVNQKVYGENHNLTLDEHYLALGDNSYLENLHIIGENMGGSLLTTYYANNKAHIHNLDILMNSSKHTNTGRVLGGNIYLTGDIKVTMMGDNTTTGSIYTDAISASNMQLDKDATLDIEIKNFVNQTSVSMQALEFDGGKSRIDGTVNINIENIINNRSGGPGAIIYYKGDTVINGDVNIKMTGIRNPSNYAPKSSAGIGLYNDSVNEPNDVLIFNGKLNMDLEGTNFAIYSDYNSNFILNGDTDVVIKNLQQGIINGRDVNKNKGIISGTAIAFSKTFSISQDDTDNFIGNDTILNFASENSHLILSTTSSSNANYSEENFGVKNIKTQAVKDAKWSLDTKYFSTEKRCHTTYDVVDEYYAYPPKEYWSDACEFSTQQECTDVDSNTVCELASDGCWKVTECDEANGWYYSDGVCKPRDCSDYQLTDCPYASCTNMSFNKYSDENICISAGVKTYHLSYCGSYNVKTGYYLKKGSISCLPRDCSLFHIQKEPKNQIAYNACYSGSKTSYLVGRCKDGYYYRNVETDYGCVEKPITNVCDGFPLTSQPSFASSSIKEYLTCKEGTKNKYLIIECKSGYVVNGDYCSNSSSAFKYDACPENSICTSKSITNSSTKVTSVKYGVSKCVTGYHFDANGNCVENSSDCADFANSPIYDKTKHSVDNAAFCLAKNGNIYTMVGRCKPGHVPTGNTCVAKPTPYDMIGRHMYDGPCDPTLGVYCSGQATGVYFSENGYSSSGDYYAYLRGCDHGYHWDGYSCVANKCPDFPFTEKPANSKTYSGYISCYEGTTDGNYITKYRAIACEKGYRLNNHGCEPIE